MKNKLVAQPDVWYQFLPCLQEPAPTFHAYEGFLVKYALGLRFVVRANATMSLVLIASVSGILVS